MQSTNNSLKWRERISLLSFSQKVKLLIAHGWMRNSGGYTELLIELRHRLAHQYDEDEIVHVLPPHRLLAFVMWTVKAHHQLAMWKLNVTEIDPDVFQENGAWEEPENISGKQ